MRGLRAVSGHSSTPTLFLLPSLSQSLPGCFHPSAQQPGLERILGCQVSVGLSDCVNYASTNPASICLLLVLLGPPLGPEAAQGTSNPGLPVVSS